MHIDGWTLLLQIINLAVLVALLRWLFYRPLLRVIDARRQAAAAEIARARDAQQQADAQRQALAGERAALETERAELLATGRAQVEQEREAARQAAARQADEALAAARRRADDERQVDRRALQDDAAELACDLARRLLQATPAGGDAGFVEALLEKLRAVPAAEREQWFASSAPRSALLATAGTLEPSLQQRLAGALDEALGAGVTIDFAADPALLAGAELRLPHGVLAYHWAGLLAQARAALAAVPLPPAAS